MGQVSENIRLTERLSLSDVIPGMELARDIYSRTDQMILSRGSILDEQKILKIAQYSIDTITVFKQERKVEKTLTEQLKSSAEFRRFSQKYDDTVFELKQTLNSIITDNKEINQDELVRDIENMINEVGSTGRVFNMLHCIRDYDEVTYMHSVNVALICNCFARWLGMSDSEKKVLTLGGLLHDVGKTTISKDILMKPDRLTAAEFNLIKTHTLKGYNLLRDKNIDDKIKMMALLHHERSDGSGYPFSKVNEEIEPFARILAIADVFDAMTSDRAYRPKFCCFDVLGQIERGGASFDPSYAVPLVEQLANVYIGHTVRLSDGSTGKVILLNKGEISKPVVQIGDDFVDLTKKRDLTIREVL